jgi:hypothetical protein
LIAALRSEGFDLEIADLGGGLGELLGQLRDDLEQVADQADVGDLEDRRFLVLVDGDDDFESFMPARCWIAPEMPIAI